MPPQSEESVRAHSLAKVLDIVTRILAPILLAQVTWLVTYSLHTREIAITNQYGLKLVTEKLVALSTDIDRARQTEMRVVRIESSMFTSSDAQTRFASIERKVDVAISEMASIKSSIPKESPPPWFVDRVKGIEDALKDIKRDVDALRTMNK